MIDTDAEVIGPINLGNPNEMTVRELAEFVVDLTGSRSKLVHRPLPADDPKQRRPDISEANKVLGWRPTTPLKEGLSKTILYFEGLLAAGRIPQSDAETSAARTVA
jgi:UDP-glucuronate decarboxylase